MKNLSGSLIIGYDFSSSDKWVLIVGTQDRGEVTIINAFQDEEAKELFDRLTTKKQKGE